MTSLRGKPSDSQPAKPIIWFDGNCAFCRHQVDRLLYLCGWRADASPLQSSLAPGTTVEEMKLQMPSGELYGGAEAVFRSLALSPLFRPLLWLYLIPGIRQIFNAGYRVIANNRYNMAISACPTGSCGIHVAGEGLDHPQATVPALAGPTYRRSAKMFLTSFCALYAIAFASLFVQILPLNGSKGLQPTVDLLQRVDREFAPIDAETKASSDASTNGIAATDVGNSDDNQYNDWRQHPIARVPTLFWFDASDNMLRAGCIVGFALAILAMFGVFRRTLLVVLGVLYLSYVTAGGVFFGFQWDNLQLEMTLHAVLLPSFAIPLIFRGPRRRFAVRYRAPHPIVIFLMLWLLFRVYFESGLAKILAVGGGWRDLSAMQHYYDTAPLATWLGWKAHHLPVWWHQIESALVLLIEFVLPIFIFSRRWMRGILFIVFSAFQVAIILTANYGLFNYLTLILGLFLLDDRHYEPLIRFGRRLRGAFSKARATAAATRDKDQVYVPSVTGWLMRSMLLFVVAIVIVTASLVEMSTQFLDRQTQVQLRAWAAPPSTDGTADASSQVGDNWFMSGLADGYYAYTHARLISKYHLFANMTRTRNVPVFQGLSDDGEWITYPYRWAPGDASIAPSIVAPFHPRLDFQIWFHSMQRGLATRIVSLLMDDPTVAADFFASDPFAGSRPKKLRVLRTRYHMSDPQVFDEHGWWIREPAGILIPPINVPARIEAPAEPQSGDSEITPSPPPGADGNAAESGADRPVSSTTTDGEASVDGSESPPANTNGAVTVPDASSNAPDKAADESEKPRD